GRRDRQRRHGPLRHGRQHGRRHRLLDGRELRVLARYAGAAVSRHGGGGRADRYFQPYAGQSSANDMYFARAQFVFADNMFASNGIGGICTQAGASTTKMDFNDPTIANLLVQHGVAWSWYAGGYKAMKDANPTSASQCPTAPAE